MSRGTNGVDLPLALDVNTLGVAVAVVGGDAVFLFAPHTAFGSVAVALAFFDADLLSVAVVSTGRAWLGGVLITSTFPFSALNRHSLFALDFGSLRCLFFVLVCRRKDAERDSGGAIVSRSAWVKSRGEDGLRDSGVEIQPGESHST